MMEMIIKISEKDYNDILNGETKASSLNYTIFHAIKNGVLLPKGHGRLVNTSYFEHYLRDTYIDSVGFNRAMNAMKQLPTIIEADKTESEG